MPSFGVSTSDGCLTEQCPFSSSRYVCTVKSILDQVTTVTFDLLMTARTAYESQSEH